MSASHNEIRNFIHEHLRFPFAMIGDEKSTPIVWGLAAYMVEERKRLRQLGWIVIVGFVALFGLTVLELLR